MSERADRATARVGRVHAIVMAVKPRPGDLVRAAIVLAVVGRAAAETPRAAIALALIAPPAFALRMLPVGHGLDALFCMVLLIAQVGAEAGLTETTGWWDDAAHAVTAALLAIVILRLRQWRSAAEPVVAVTALGIAWELVEWASDAAYDTNFSAGATDTLSDLALDLAGAGAAVMALQLYRRRQRRSSRRSSGSPRSSEVTES
jgi:hypothetical protein